MKHFPQSLVLLKKNTIKISLEPHTHTHTHKNPLSSRQIVINNLIDKNVILVVEFDRSR